MAQMNRAPASWLTVWPLGLAAIIASSSLTSASSAIAGPSAPAGMGTNAGSASAGPAAPPGMGTKDSATGVNPSTNNQMNNANIELATPTKSRTAAQTVRMPGRSRAKWPADWRHWDGYKQRGPKDYWPITRPDHICPRSTGQRKHRCGSRNCGSRNSWSADRNVWEGHQSFGPGERATRRASWR